MEIGYTQQMEQQLTTKIVVLADITTMKTTHLSIVIKPIMILNTGMFISASIALKLRVETIQITVNLGRKMEHITGKLVQDVHTLAARQPTVIPQKQSITLQVTGQIILAQHVVITTMEHQQHTACLG